MSFYRIHACENDGQQIICPSVTFDLDRGGRFDWPHDEPTHAAKKSQKLYDWLEGNCWAPFVNSKIKTRLEPATGSTVQWHGPFDVRGNSYFHLNCVDVVDCLLPGSDDNILLLNKAAVADRCLFRVMGRAPRLFCSQAFRDNCVNSGDTGVRFGRIKEDGWEDFPF